MKYKPLKKLSAIKSEKSVKQCHKHKWLWMAENSPFEQPYIEGLEDYDNSYLCYWATQKSTGRYKCNTCLLQQKCWEIHSAFDEWNMARKRKDRAAKSYAKKMASIFDEEN